MIESLTIHNFQKWRKLHVEFERITVFTGPSDSGKSSIVRAIRWVTCNRPMAISFIRSGSRACKVELKTEDSLVSRRRSHKRNDYSLRDGAVFKSFGSGVPSRIVDIINIGPVSYQGQHDQLFWFSLSPGEVSRELNQIVNLSLIDSTLANAASDVRKAKAVVEVSETRLKQAQEQRDSLRWVKEADRELKQIETLEQSIAENRTRSLVLNDLLSELGSLKEQEELLSDASREGSELLRKAEQQRNRSEELETLMSLTGELEKWREQESRAREQTEAIEERIQRETKGKCPLCGGQLRL